MVLDASDNVATRCVAECVCVCIARLMLCILDYRYLLNDSCVLLKKPLVSGSALRFEGQVIRITLSW